MTDYTRFSPAELIVACRQQDPLAWNELVTRYERLVFTVPLRYGLTKAEADDVFQSVWLALLDHLPALEQPERVSVWLVTTAKRACWDKRRGTDYEREAGVAVESLGDVPLEDEETNEEMIIQYERQTAVRQTLARLEERCRQLLNALYYATEKLDYAAIARRLNIPVGSIGPTRARCLEKLRQEMTGTASGDSR
jgi:RNA polymerase sigma factor (sigma-70 family)